MKHMLTNFWFFSRLKNPGWNTQLWIWKKISERSLRISKNVENIGSSQTNAETDSQHPINLEPAIQNVTQRRVAS